MNLDITKNILIVILAINFISLTAVENIEAILAKWKNNTDRDLIIVQVLGSTSDQSFKQLITEGERKFIGEIKAGGRMRSAKKIILEKSDDPESQKALLLIEDKANGQYIVLQINFIGIDVHAIWVEFSYGGIMQIDSGSIDISPIEEQENIGAYISATLAGDKFQDTKIDELIAYTGKIK